MFQLIEAVGPVGVVFDVILAYLKSFIFSGSAHKVVKDDYWEYEGDQDGLPIFVCHDKLTNR